MRKGVQTSKSSISKAIAARLAAAREDAGFTLRDAARALGFESYQVLSKIEKSERPVRAVELVRFAETYQRSVSYFLSTEVPSARPAVLWRGRADAPSTKRVEQKFLRYCEDYVRLEELTGRAPAEFPLGCAKEIGSYDEAHELGEGFARQMELGSHPAKEIRMVLEGRYGVKVLVDDTEGAGSAASVRDSFGAGILLSRREPPWRKNYNLAHELFHLATWDVYSPADIHPETGSKSLPEKYADAFASALLLPEMSVRKAFESRVKKDRVLTYAECITMAREFCVSTQALLYRLMGLRLVKRSEAEKAMESEDFVHQNKEQRKDDWSADSDWGVSERFIGLAFECLLSGKLSRSRCAEMLGIHRSQVDAFLTAFGYDSSGDYSVEISTS